MPFTGILRDGRSDELPVAEARSRSVFGVASCAATRHSVRVETAAGLRHFLRWLPNGWWPWVAVPAGAVAVFLLVVENPLALLATVLIPASAWFGFARHRSRVKAWKRT